MNKLLDDALVYRPNIGIRVFYYGIAAYVVLDLAWRMIVALLRFF